MFSWGHSDTQWQLPEAAAAWRKSRVSAGRAMQGEAPSLNLALQLNSNGTVARAGLDSGLMGSLGTQSDGAGIPENHRPRRAMKREARAEKFVCLPDTREVGLLHKGGHRRGHDACLSLQKQWRIEFSSPQCTLVPLWSFLQSPL